MHLKPSAANHQPSTINRVLLVGGGTGGHILPLKNLSDELLTQGTETHLVVADQSLDKNIVQESFSTSIKDHYLKAYKLHYHFSFQSFINAFRILGSLWSARKLLISIEPDAIFFKGGYVGLPILIAAKYLTNFKGKIYLHDSDISSGALSKLFGKHADRIFSNFGDEALPLFYWPKSVAAQRASTPPLPLGEDQGEGYSSPYEVSARVGYTPSGSPCQGEKLLKLSIDQK